MLNEEKSAFKEFIFFRLSSLLLKLNVSSALKNLKSGTAVFMLCAAVEKGMFDDDERPASPESEKSARMTLAFALPVKRFSWFEVSCFFTAAAVFALDSKLKSRRRE